MLCAQLSTRRKEENRAVFFFFLSVISVTQTELCLNIGAHTRITRWVVRGSKTVRRNRTKIVLRRKNNQNHLTIAVVVRYTPFCSLRAIISNVRRQCPNFNASAAAAAVRPNNRSPLVALFARVNNVHVNLYTYYNVMRVRYRIIIMRVRASAISRSASLRSIQFS